MVHSCPGQGCSLAAVRTRNAVQTPGSQQQVPEDTVADDAEVVGAPLCAGPCWAEQHLAYCRRALRKSVMQGSK